MRGLIGVFRRGLGVGPWLWAIMGAGVSVRPRNEGLRRRGFRGVAAFGLVRSGVRADTSDDAHRTGP